MKSLFTFGIVILMGSTTFAQEIFLPLVQALKAFRVDPYKAVEEVYTRGVPAHLGQIPTLEEAMSSKRCLRHLATDVTPSTDLNKMQESPGCLVSITYRVTKEVPVQKGRLGDFLFPRVASFEAVIEDHIAVVEMPRSLQSQTMKEARAWLASLANSSLYYSYDLKDLPNGLVATYPENGFNYTVNYRIYEEYLVGKILAVKGKNTTVEYDYGWFE